MKACGEILKDFFVMTLSILFFFNFSMQLSYRESLQEGASVRVLLPDTEAGSIDLPVARCVQAAVKLLRPTQESSDNDVMHYRQQAWNIVQMGGVCCSNVGIV